MAKPEIKTRIHPLVASLPDHLKDPASYDKVQKLVVKSLAGRCNHGEIVEWAGCADCQKRFTERRAILKKLGFVHPAQYMAWRKIHEKIKDYQKIKLPKYNG